MKFHVCGVKWCVALVRKLDALCPIHKQRGARFATVEVSTDDDEIEAIGDCSWCDGSGQCPRCEGSAKHECECGNEHDCQHCDEGECDECGGTGWRDGKPHTAAANLGATEREYLEWAYWVPKELPPIFEQPWN